MAEWVFGIWNVLGHRMVVIKTETGTGTVGRTYVVGPWGSWQRPVGRGHFLRGLTVRSAREDDFGVPDLSL